MDGVIPQFKVLMNPRVNEFLEPVLTSGFIGQGPKVEEFETALQRALDYDYGVTVNSCTSALQLALHLIDVRDKWVISTPMTCSATNEAIHNAGGRIVWADVDEYGNIDPESVENIVYGFEYDPAAIVAVDWGGLPCDYDRLREVAQDIPIIEDAAHAFGATYKGKSVGRSGGDYVCFSFQAIKHLTAGDGGLLVTPADQYERAKLLRWFGLDRTKGNAMRCRADIPESGFKYHMNDINATIGLANLELARNAVRAHQANAQIYNKWAEGWYLPEWPKDRESSFWLYTIHVPEPVEFEQYMAKRGIAVSQVHNRNDSFSFLEYARRPLPQLDKFFSWMVCLPVGWWLSASDIEKIIFHTQEYLNGD